MDKCKLDGFTFTHQPVINAYWEPQFSKHTLSDGSTVIYNKGYILKGSLSWGDNGWVDGDELSNICVMYNFLTGTAHFFPKQNSLSGSSYHVHITNELNFTPHGGMLQNGIMQFYQGSIEFESSLGEITATAFSIF